MALRPTILFLALVLCAVAQVDDAAACTDGVCKEGVDAEGVAAQVDDAAACTDRVCKEGVDATGVALVELDVFETISTWVNDIFQAFENDKMSHSAFAGLKRSNLQDIAYKYGATKGEVDAALDADNSEAALVDLVLMKVPPKECSKLCESVRERWMAVKEAASKFADSFQGVKQSINETARHMAGNIAKYIQQAKKQAAEYKFGDLTRGTIARGKVERGADLDDTYQFGDFTRGALSFL
jgi:hypothetical protein